MTPTSRPSSSPRARPAGVAALVLALLATSLVAGCMPLAVGGGTLAGLAVMDRRTTGVQVEDETIEQRAKQAIYATLDDERVRITATSFNRQVLLTGEALTAEEKQKAQQLVARVPNVRNVVDDVAVMAPVTASTRSADALITSKVKASIFDAKDLHSGAFIVTTDRGIVYLMGRVTQREARRAAEIARGVSGVTKVVRVFELLSEQELEQINRQQAPAPAMQPAAQSASQAAGASPAPVSAPAAADVVATPVR